MAITSNLYAVFSANTASGPNQPVTTDVYSNIMALGSYAAGPAAFGVTSTPAALPLSTTVTSQIYGLLVQHTGGITDPNIILDMQNASAQSSKILLMPGGRFYLFNGGLSINTTTGFSDYSKWRISTVLGTTTAAVTLVYT